jgi:hypothetical protein
MLFWAFIASMFLFIVCMCVFLARHERRLRDTPWESVATGVHDHTEYGFFMERYTSGTGRLKSSGYREMDVTVVYFTDGRTCVMRGRRSMPFPSGVRIAISRHPLHGHKIEAAEDPA